MGILEQVQEMPPDPIFGVVADFLAHTHPQKCSFLIGYYRDDEGKTPLLSSVAVVEKALTEENYPREYLPIDGDAQFLSLAEELIFGTRDDRIAKIQTVGGTGALSLCGLLVKNWTDTVAISHLTWANHWNIFAQAGLQTVEYRYFSKQELTFAQMEEDIAALSEHSCVLIHASCHNPTGLDLSHEQWQHLLAIVKKKKLFPILDFAYQGFGSGVEKDAYGPRLFLSAGIEFAVTYTFAKNFSLYGERAGALFVVGNTKKGADRALSQLKRFARTTYSNPPMHPAFLVRGVLGDATLKKVWLGELQEMRNRMEQMRRSFATKMAEKDPKGSWAHVVEGKGLFAMTGLSQSAVMQLREKQGIFFGGEGRLNLTGLHADNLDLVTSAIASMR